MNDELTYEQALERLDAKLHELEEGDLTLEGALAATEEATVYLRICQARLDEARRKIEVRAAEPVPPPGAGDLEGPGDPAATEPTGGGAGGPPPPVEEGRLL